ncbi:uncharacterized protein LOC126278681 isoform X1 [Schistocerca gregaria]|uniref:uncharacterized protein LOC126278681 isoform X1 n=1 Tax=Schistocerca gregaria TaxID=7010 RepID=UPI00211DDE0E|nr:uncharacterized protein LOC126278681 isoform X1 [Schistocerca gregaria]
MSKPQRTSSSDSSAGGRRAVASSSEDAGSSAPSLSPPPLPPPPPSPMTPLTSLPPSPLTSFPPFGVPSPPPSLPTSPLWPTATGFSPPGAPSPLRPTSAPSSFRDRLQEALPSTDRHVLLPAPRVVSWKKSQNAEMTEAVEGTTATGKNLTGSPRYAPATASDQSSDNEMSLWPVSGPSGMHATPLSGAISQSALRSDASTSTTPEDTPVPSGSASAAEYAGGHPEVPRPRLDQSQIRTEESGGVLQMGGPLATGKKSQRGAVTVSTGHQERSPTSQRRVTDGTNSTPPGAGMLGVGTVKQWTLPTQTAVRTRIFKSSPIHWGTPDTSSSNVQLEGLPRRRPSPERRPRCGSAPVCWPQSSLGSWGRSKHGDRRRSRSRERSKSVGTSPERLAYTDTEELSTSQSQLLRSYSSPREAFKRTETSSEFTIKDLDGAIGKQDVRPYSSASDAFIDQISTGDHEWGSNKDLLKDSDKHTTHHWKKQVIRCLSESDGETMCSTYQPPKYSETESEKAEGNENRRAESTSLNELKTHTPLPGDEQSCSKPKLHAWILPLDDSAEQTMVIFEESNDSDVILTESFKALKHEHKMVERILKQQHNVEPLAQLLLEEQKVVAQHEEATVEEDEIFSPVSATSFDAYLDNSPVSEWSLEAHIDRSSINIQSLEAFPQLNPMNERPYEAYLDDSPQSCHSFNEYPESDQSFLAYDELGNCLIEEQHQESQASDQLLQVLELSKDCHPPLETQHKESWVGGQLLELQHEGSDQSLEEQHGESQDVDLPLEVQHAMQQQGESQDTNPSLGLLNGESKDADPPIGALKGENEKVDPPLEALDGESKEADLPLELQHRVSLDAMQQQGESEGAHLQVGALDGESEEADPQLGALDGESEEADPQLGALDGESEEADPQLGALDGESQDAKLSQAAQDRVSQEIVWHKKRQAQYEERKADDMSAKVQHIESRDVTGEMSLEGALYVINKPPENSTATLSYSSVVSQTESHISLPTNLSTYEQLPPQLLPVTVTSIAPPEEHEDNSAHKKNETEAQLSYLPVTLPAVVSAEAQETETQNEAQLPLTLVEYMALGQSVFAPSIDSMIASTVTTTAGGLNTVSRGTLTSTSLTDYTDAVPGSSRMHQERLSPQPGPSQFRYQYPLAPGSRSYRYQQPLAPGSMPYRYQQPLAPGSDLYRYQQPMVPGSSQYRYPTALVPTQYQQQTPQGNILGTGDSDDDPGYLSESSGELQNNARLVQYPADWQPALIREPDLHIIIAFIESSTAQNAAPKQQSADTPDQEQVLLKEGGDDQPGADNIDITAASVQQSDQGDNEQSLPPSASDDPHLVEDTEETQVVAKASTSSNAQPMTPTKETSYRLKSDTPRGKKNLTRRWKEHQTLKTSSSSDSDTEARRHELWKYQQESLAIGGRATMEEFLVLQQDLEQYYERLKLTEGGDGHAPEAGPSGEQQPVAASQCNQRSQATDLATADVSQAERGESSASTDTREPKEACEPVVSDVSSD